MIENAIQAQLAATTALTALVSTRIYHMRLPEGASVPAVVYRRISRLGFPDYSGVNQLVNSRVQIDCWGAQGNSAANVAQQVRIALNGLNATVASVRVYRAFLIDEASDYEVETELYRRRQDYQFSHDETIS